MTFATLKEVRGYAPEMFCQPIGSVDRAAFQTAVHMAEVFAFLDRCA